MSVFDFLQADICEVEDCGNEAFRKCMSGCGWRCAEHPCMHMSNAEGSWLSTENVIQRMTDQELSEARLRLSLQISAIDNEVVRRKFRPIQPPAPTESQVKKALDRFLDSLTPQQRKILEKKMERDDEDN